MLLRRNVRTYSSAGKEFWASNKNGRVMIREEVKIILSLVHSQRNTLDSLLIWKHSGHQIGTSELNLAIRELRNLNRFRHALQICEWKIQEKEFELSDSDYAMHLYLVSKIHGTKRAKEFFEEIPASIANAFTYTTLLNCYVNNNSVVKAEAFMAKMLKSSMVNGALPYCRMISLYIANGQLEKVPKVIQVLKENTSPDISTYNLWLTYCLKKNEVETAEQVLSELKEANIIPNMLTYSVLANLYSNNGLNVKATDALIELEKFSSRKHRTIYSSLLSLHAKVGDKEGVQRGWNKMKNLFHFLNDSEYIHMIASLLKLEGLEEAEEVYAEWESVSIRKDSKVSNLLLAAYINRDKMGIAEKFYKRMSKSGVKDSYTTFELLTWGFSKQKDVKKALHYFVAALNSLQNWKPDEKLVAEVFNAIEEDGNTEAAEILLDVLRNACYLTTEIYNSVLRTYERAGKLPLLVEERMIQDEIPMDEETCALLKTPEAMSLSSYLRD